ncbi:hypothetical protein QEJ31_11875 [Pigmentibacter sp. JX0631]|uniref:hypothetical protein n=1 Tax=Pigmentibacter sp. JX0631 TaxID=2976982 RepID=UPI002468CBC0|nr:hypothetical protein [Pigmentibacter sp. JX0631]WGL59220.1 hypothetical protein QEJ31_11875 [Pigmentibacter sp. JX0631]
MLKKTFFFFLMTLALNGAAKANTEQQVLKPFIRIQSRYSIYDSYRNNQSDTINSLGLGILYKAKNIFGAFNCQVGLPADPYSSQINTSPSTTNGSQNLLSIRRAFVGVSGINFQNNSLSFIIGRYRVTGPVLYTPDALDYVIATNLTLHSSLVGSDGIFLKFSGDYDTWKFSSEFGFVNSIQVAQIRTGGNWFFIPQIVNNADTTFGSSPNTQSRAFIGSLGSDFSISDGVLELRALYGSQQSAVTKVSGDTNYTARDVSDFESSVSYNYKSGIISGGIWFQSVYLGQSKSGIKSATNQVNYSNSTNDDSQTINTSGLSFILNSKFFNLSDFLEKEDSIFLTLAYQKISGLLVSGGGASTGVTSFSNQSLNNDIINAGFGYKQEAFSLEIDYLYTKANYEIYTNNNGIQNQKEASILYLIGTLLLQ